MSIYCVYLTTYSGNKLPPFYIGYSSVFKVVEKNYNGTVLSAEYKETWKKERKDNPHLFKTKIISYHVTAECAKAREHFLLTFFDAKRNPMYINKHNGGLSFINTKTRRGSEHHFFGKSLSDVHKKNLSNSMKGKNFWLQTPEVRAKIGLTKRTQNKGSGNGRARKVTDGTRIFDTLTECASYHNIHFDTVSYRIRSTSIKNADWTYVIG